MTLAAGGDLDLGMLSQVRAHVGICAECGREEQELLQVINAGRSAFSPASALPEVAVRRIARAAAEQAVRPWSPPLSLFARPVRSGVLASVAAVLIALVAIPVGLKNSGPTAVKEPLKIDVVVQGDAVLLAWSDGVKGTYTVRKSDDPRAFSRGEAHIVSGNVWADTQPDSSPIVFYRID
jgi:anti-sigma factor RsiW